MFRKIAATGLMFVAVTLLSAGEHQRPILLGDFDDGTTEGWEPNDFTGVGVTYVYKGRLVIETTEAIPIDDPSVGTVEAHFEASHDHPKFANGTLRTTIRANTDGTTVGFLLRDNDETGTDYGFFGSTSFGTFYIERFDLGANPDAPQTIIAMADADEFPFRAGEDWNIEVSAIGHKITMKAWKVGHPEPKKPMLVVKDKVLGPDSGSEIAAVVFFDYFPLALDGVTEVWVSGAVDNVTFTPAK